MKYLPWLFLGLPIVLFSQNFTNDTKSRFRYPIKKTTQTMTLDGEVGPKEWESHKAVSNFFNHWPTDLGQAKNQTEVKMTYDDTHVYLLAKCYDTESRIVQSLVRDNNDNYWGSDNFSLVFDPIGSKQNGFFFGVTAGGAEMEATLAIEEGNTSLSENWDNRWASKVKEYEGYWLVEMAIPFKTLRYDANATEWGVNFIRGDKQNNAYTTWTQFPINFNGISMNYMGTLVWDAPPKKAAGMFIFNPYSTLSSQRDYEDDNQNSPDTQINIGGDIKVALSSSLNLDLTFLPDFSNADVDQEITNITRFNIFLPEQRNFFLENSDIFSNFGSYDLKPFFSRRIGIMDGEAIPIDFGARLTGNLTKNLRIGVMDVQTQREGDFIPQNYAVAAFQQTLLKRSVFKGIFINRQATATSPDDEKYSRNAGLEFTYMSEDGRFNNNVKYHLSFMPQGFTNNHYYGFAGNYTTKRFRSGWQIDVVGENYITEVGVNPRLENYNAETEETVRLGYTLINPWFRYLTFSKDDNSKINYHGWRTWHMLYLNSDGTFNETMNNLAYDFEFRNTASLSLISRYRKVNLMFPTALIGDDFEPLPLGDYEFARFDLMYSADTRKQFVWSTNMGYGSFYNGTRLNAMLEGNIRFQPWGRFGITYNYNDIKLAEGYGANKLHLVRFNADIGFSNKLSWKNVVQYNSQSENFSAFSRLQWRYRPMSDIFLIYNENHDTNGFGIKNRSLVLKMTYWL
ncbi:carbohydrate binding family 9 domain-containing protein [Sediminicola luteus]|uniref:Uncharacterized protein n=1 Tax=Sediminicola luteus TaxID=319238 RepID=A0A2A4G612_9FLAO|nr:carbohydrate binding family 9 domain-containing protein [Sediminicola luteus]PCE64087.1 hypothetical protein B7P33_12700 [Sediminicola luteus]